MFQSFIKSVGLAPLDAYVEPRISIGNAVADREYSTGHFRIQLDAEKLALFIRNEKGRVIWKSLHNLPFLSSSAGVDEIVADKGECGVFKIAERDDHPTLLQTVTHVEKQDNKVIIYGGLGARIVKPTHMDYEFSLEEVSPHQLRLAACITRRDANMVGYRRLLLMFESRKEEHFYGFGEQFSHGSVKGQKVPILVRERGRVPTSSMLNAAYSFVESYIGGTESDFASYISVPHYITSDKRSMFLENAQYCSFNLTEPDRVIIRIDADDIAGRIIDRDSILDLIQEYTDYCGRMKPLPDWVMQGAIACIQGGSNKVQRILEQLIRHETPLAAVWLPDWSGQRLQQITSKVAWKRVSWTWESDSQLYPSWGNFVHQLREDSNVRVLTYMTPYLVDNLNGRRNLYREALDAGYLVKYIDRAVATFNNQGILAGLLDLTNEDARAWFKQALKGQIYDDGVSGLVADMAEGLPYRSGQVTLCSGQTPTETYHNKYAEDWAQLHREIAEEIAEEREMPLCIFRTGFLQSPKYASVFCTGNQDVSWDAHNGIKSALAAMLSGGFSGFSLTHSDIGGYSTIEGILPGASMVRSRELLFRWMELAAFTAVFRTNEGILPERNAQFYNDEETYEQFARMTKLYVCLAPYRKRLMQEAYEKGWPLMRHPVMYYPEDSTVQEIIYQQFFFGGDLLVAPNLSPSTAFVKVYFPRDSAHSWRHIWSGKYFEPDGSYKSVDAPLGQPAVFIKEPRQDDGLLNGLIDFANNYVAPLTT